MGCSPYGSIEELKKKYPGKFESNDGDKGEKENKKPDRKLRKTGRKLRRAVIREIKRFKGHISRAERKEIKGMSVKELVNEANSLEVSSKRTKKLVEKASKMLGESGNRVERVEKRHRVM